MKTDTICGIDRYEHSKLKKLFLYYLVSCDEYPKHQEGWLRAEMLKERGKHRPGIKA